MILDYKDIVYIQININQKIFLIKYLQQYYL